MGPDRRGPEAEFVGCAQEMPGGEDVGDALTPIVCFFRKQLSAR
jgi:hypothetical protein